MAFSCFELNPFVDNLIRDAPRDDAIKSALMKATHENVEKHFIFNNLEMWLDWRNSLLQNDDCVNVSPFLIPAEFLISHLIPESSVRLINQKISVSYCRIQEGEKKSYNEKFRRLINGSRVCSRSNLQRLSL